MIDAKDKRENAKTSEAAPEIAAIPIEQGPSKQETRESLKEDKIVSRELMREIEMMELDENTKAEAEKAKEKIEFLAEKDKIEHLLRLAQSKGVVFAVQVARRMKEPYLLDLLHDTLAAEGFYKDFTK